MSSKSLPKFKLRGLILVLAVFSVLITLGNSFYATYEVQRSLLINNTLEANRVYAAKLAEVTDVFLDMAQDRLAYSAEMLSDQMHSEAGLVAEVRRLQEPTNTFNSVVVVNDKARVLAVSPEALGLSGETLHSRQARLSIAARAPVITDPFISAAGNYLISLSHPIFAANGEYLGYIAGSIYLQQKNILNDILGKHYYQDGSYLYVVDRNKTLIYHPNPERIGQRIEHNPAIDEVIAGNEGAYRVTNSQGVAMLAGFAPVTNAGWGVVAQRPNTMTLAGLDGHIIKVFLKSLPLVLLTLLGIWLSALLISRPLWQLASGTRQIDNTPLNNAQINNRTTQDNISHINSWYFEAAQLKRAIIKSMGLLNDKISQLHSDSHTDAMTELLNRRAMTQVLDSYQQAHTPFSVITLDIDLFKRINDTYGHDVGDEVIKKLAQLMRLQARKEDQLCRSGGEEFMIFLPNTSQDTAVRVAERLRELIAATDIPTVGTITVSLGVGHWSGADSATSINDTLKLADQALYQAKQQGRNQTVAL
ncbi:diguanylate cyclase [Oceanisphaera profunda]|uniref:diguanylate cyclase n=1 Tax=Oceanisphaera profunda TaxID=1416627 RepID=A0A1Y0D7I8_9GAMM|nr:sensor domain-containing diguanylate cyclase [Oceanisphaera profunda]ART83511.1 diguanylate cyclase [Oceanisphaera profunda]